ncbi:matrilin-4 [Protopterus annectens]|uniref:matrilin-4 n=1 Tax=Protopterus annectens TaxID=7888 RepID=UPI001CF9DCD4|nr:matrilin-4 [Protopterus annectens]XP_043946017.1 matrilin-4 [Protopterus annectens]XP_043946018.1 matrilin-4 [Protopterus annectens]XP_043946019.1 matrilin-4 [Protopterus annectens]
MKRFVFISLYLLAVTRLDAAPQIPGKTCRTGPLDLVFIIDSSRSVRPFEFETMRKFMINIIDVLDVGVNATRVGVVQYSSQVQNVFSLKSFFKKQDIVKAINDIIPLAQGTMTGLAIQHAMNVAFTVEEGARPLDLKIPRVAVIVTDGRPQDRVTEVSARARETGIEIYAVGVQRADMNSLRAMASPPLEKHVFLVESFDLIHQFGVQFQKTICVDVCNDTDHGCQHKCVSTPGSYYCECNPGFRLNDDGKTCSAIDLCAERKHDCQHICVASPGSYTCRCRPGYILNDDKKTCRMIDLCAQGKHDCEHICVASPGSYTCRCRPGYILNDDKKTCRMIDMCAEGKNDCEQICVASPGSYTCRCRPGYLLNDDKKTCRMIDYCSFGNHSCQHECVNVLNGYYCRCNEGFVLQEDGKTCKPADFCNTIDHGCEFQCVSTPGSYHCICPEGQLLQDDGKSCGKCKTGHVDLVFVIDGSKSVRPENFELVKQFVNQIIDSLDVSLHGTHVGLVQYSSRVRTEFPLKAYHTVADIKKAVSQVQYMEKGTMTGLALKHMVEQSFSDEEGARHPSKNIPRIGVVFTDGRSQDSISEWAAKAKEADITMYAIGVGKAVEEELKEIASEPVDKHFFYSADFTTINLIADNLKLRICPEESKGETEIKDPCECESLVQFQTTTLETLGKLTSRLDQMTARLAQLENQLAEKK